MRTGPLVFQTISSSEIFDFAVLQKIRILCDGFYRFEYYQSFRQIGARKYEHCALRLQILSFELGNVLLIRLPTIVFLAFLTRCKSSSGASHNLHGRLSHRCEVSHYFGWGIFPIIILFPMRDKILTKLTFVIRLLIIHLAYFLKKLICFRLKNLQNLRSLSRPSLLYILD